MIRLTHVRDQGMVRMRYVCSWTSNNQTFARMGSRLMVRSVVLVINEQLEEQEPEIASGANVIKDG